VLADDLTPFFVAGEFCDEEDTLNGASVLGMFDDAYVVNGAGFGLSDTTTAYHMATASVPPLVEGMHLIHKHVEYNVVDQQPDGSGITTLVLEKA